MKSSPIRSLVAVAALLLSASSGFGDQASYAAVVNERDGVLSEILALREGRRSSGTADETAIAAAQLALYSFRRDTATTTAAKITNQELILQIMAKKVETVRAHQRLGVGSAMELLEARASFLEAKQVLEALKLGEKSN